MGSITDLKDWLKDKIREKDPITFAKMKVQQELFNCWEAFAKVLGDMKIYRTQVTVTVNKRKWTFNVDSKPEA